MSGIRHYYLFDKNDNDEDKKKNKKSDDQKKNKASLDKDKQDPKEKVNIRKEEIRHFLSEKLFDEAAKRRKKDEIDEFSLDEYYIKENFDSIDEALKLFQDDDLLHKPGW